MKALPEIPNRRDVAIAFKEDGGSIAGVLPIHYPRALMRAFHFLPIEIWGPPGVDSTFGEAHLQPYVCSIVRNALSFIQSDVFEMVDLVVVPHACDSLQGLGSILLDFVPPTQPVLVLYLPRGNERNAQQFLAAEFKTLYQSLEVITSYSPTDDDLMDAILREERADQILWNLHLRRSVLGLSNYEFYRLIRSREFLPAEEFIKIGESVLSRSECESSNGIPIVLTGIIPEPMALLKAIDEFGGWIVADDLACCGRRLYPPGESKLPFQRMAEGIIKAPPDWSRGSSIQARLDHLIAKCKDVHAEGVIFLNIKFCEPELFDIPNIREALKNARIPSTVIEVEINEPLSNSLLTRVEAFLEMIA